MAEETTAGVSRRNLLAMLGGGFLAFLANPFGLLKPREAAAAGNGDLGMITVDFSKIAAREQDARASLS